tara:strand:+ start:1414 stop:2340 length:927 start_codon:yes stop_codon:yes gene_type:complete
MLSKLNKNLGLLLFNNPNTINYIIFNKFYSKFISKIKDLGDDALEFHKNGFVKTKDKSLKLVDFINNNIINKQQNNISENETKYLFSIPDECREKILKLLYQDYGLIIKDLEKYYNNKIGILEIIIKRHFPISSEENYYQNTIRDKSKEFYSNYYHVDYYVGTYFKMFINLQDVSEKNGPLNIYNIKSSKEFIIKNNYKSRLNYKVNDLQDKLFKNIGDKGQTVIANTTKCLHKAENVQCGKRDVMVITFGAIPEKVEKDANTYFDYYEKKNSEIVWNKNGQYTKIYKPKNFKSTIKLLINFFKAKIA